MTNRFEQIKLVIDFIKPRSIVEIGTWNSDRAIEMSTTALDYNSCVHYWGFDLIEQGGELSDQKELNVTPHISTTASMLPLIISLIIYFTGRFRILKQIRSRVSPGNV